MVVAGCGFASQFHLQAWQRIPGVQVVALWNRTPERLAQRAAEFGIARTYLDYREMLERERPDAVDIVVPQAAHLEQVCAAAERGVHVLCQKPFADSMSAARQMVDTCERYGVRLMVNENWRWRPWYRAMKRLVEDGALGAPFYCSIRSRGPNLRLLPGQAVPYALARQPQLREMPRLALLEYGIHLVDVTRFLFGEISSVYAQVRKITDAVQGEELVNLALNAGNVVATVEISMGSYGYPVPRAVEAVAIEGDLGTALCDYDGRLVVRTRDGEYDVPVDAHEHYLRMYQGAIGHFVEGLRTGAPFETDGRDNLRTLEVTLRAYDSAAANEVVHF